MRRGTTWDQKAVQDEISFLFARICGRHIKTWKRGVAYHEAGHALAYYIFFGRIIDSVSVASTNHQRPLCSYTKKFADRIDHIWTLCGYEKASVEDKAIFDKFLIASYAGSAAEARFLGKSFNEVAITETDYYEVRDTAKFVSGRIFDDRDSVLMTYLKNLQTQTNDMIAIPQNWHAIEALVNVLLVKRVISGEKAADILAEALPEKDDLSGLESETPNGVGD